MRLSVAKQFDEPILTIHSAGAEENKYGFEGGRVFKHDGAYHLFTSEIIGDPLRVKMRLAHWVSDDRLRWRRASTLFESSGDLTGRGQRTTLWSPMPVYNPVKGRWNLFYVACPSAPDIVNKGPTNHEGKVWRAVSRVRGPGGIDGPYEDVGIISPRGKAFDPWEGLQGTDSFFPYRAGKKWYAFYGTGHTEKPMVSLSQIGLAWAPELDGPWKQCTEFNPLRTEKVFVESPVVTRLSDGTYAVVFNNKVEHSIGYAFSADGINWTHGRSLVVQKGNGTWASEIRTPLGLIPEGKDSFTLFYTANQDLLGVPPDARGIKPTPGALGLVEVKLKRIDSNSLAGRNP